MRAAGSAVQGRECIEPPKLACVPTIWPACCARMVNGSDGSRSVGPTAPRAPGSRRREMPKARLHRPRSCGVSRPGAVGNSLYHFVE
jgi:hypothetical protein